MNEHTQMELVKIVKTLSSRLPSSAAKRKPVMKDRQGEVEGTNEPILLHSNADTINSYYILLQTLADKESRATTQRPHQWSKTSEIGAACAESDSVTTESVIPEKLTLHLAKSVALIDGHMMTTGTRSSRRNAS